MVKNNKTRASDPRAGEDRVEEGRDLRGDIEMGPKSVLALPDSVFKDGFRYFYQRYKIKGKDDEVLESSVADDWTPVDVERHSKRRNLNVLNRNTYSSKFICVEDVMLLEKEEFLCHERDVWNHNRDQSKLFKATAYNYNRQDHLNNSLGVFGR